jgi:hypothetical protein
LLIQSTIILQLLRNQNTVLLKIEQIKQTFSRSSCTRSKCCLKILFSIIFGNCFCFLFIR